MLNTIVIGIIFNIIVSILIGAVLSVLVTIDTRGYEKEPVFFGSKLEKFIWFVLITSMAFVYSNWAYYEIKENNGWYFLICTAGFFLAIPYKVYTLGRDNGQYKYMLIIAIVYSLGIFTDLDKIHFFQKVGYNISRWELISL
jgi:hypothetical protein